jgi:RNA polymerase sigma-70 factor (ECF subfamily)
MSDARSPSPVPTDTDARDERLAGLMARVAVGDRAAFEQLYCATAPYLLGLALAVLGRRDRAEDALQEAYLNVWHGAAGFNPALARPMTWLINIVRHKAIDKLRAGRTQAAADVELDEAMQLPADAATQPERLLADSLTKLRIDQCMAALSAPQRQALALAHYRGLVVTEVAAVMRAPLGTAKAWLRRGGDRLRDCLQAAGVQAA